MFLKLFWGGFLTKYNGFKCLHALLMVIQVWKILLRYHKSLLELVVKRGSCQTDAVDAKKRLNNQKSHFSTFSRFLKLFWGSFLTKTSGFKCPRPLLMAIQTWKMLLRYHKSLLESMVERGTCQTVAVYAKNCPNVPKSHFS